jgi:hypothetical protein
MTLVEVHTSVIVMVGYLRPYANLFSTYFEWLLVSTFLVCESFFFLGNRYCSFPLEIVVLGEGAYPPLPLRLGVVKPGSQLQT